MQRWIELLSTFTLVGGEEQDTRTDEQLRSFEVTHGIILPGEYKDFCKIFGSGVFGYYLTVYCPEVEQVDVQYLKDELSQSIGVEGSEFGYRLRSGETLSDIDLIQAILNSAFIFASTSGGEVFLWNLQSHNQLDDNYDIYITRVEDFPGIYRVGRSFFEFIQTFALGTGSYDSLPEWTQPSLGELDDTFTPIKVPVL